jgi:hypothetical protein
MPVDHVRRQARSRITGTIVQVVDLAHPDSDICPDGENRWATICLDHGGFCSHLTLAHAAAHAPNPGLWCPTCSGEDA